MPNQVKKGNIFWEAPFKFEVISFPIEPTSLKILRGFLVVFVWFLFCFFFVCLEGFLFVFVVFLCLRFWVGVSLVDWGILGGCLFAFAFYFGV